MRFNFIFLDLQTYLDYQFWGNSLGQYLIFLAYMVGSLLVGQIFYFLLKKIIRQLVKKTATELDDLLLNSMQTPLVLAVILLGFHVGYQQLNIPNQIIQWLDRLAESFLVILIAVFLLKSSQKISKHYITIYTHTPNANLSLQVLPLVKLVLRVVIVIVTVIWVISNMGYNITSLLASLGIGGLAVALAAQDLLKNIFSGLIIMIDQPFKIGDWIKIRELQGVVQQVGLRSTRIKTSAEEFITIPNHLITESSIVNLTKFATSRISFVLGLTYRSKVADIQEVKTTITEILNTTEGIVKGNYELNFATFGAYSLELTLAFTFEGNTPNQQRTIRDKVNMQIKQAFDQKGIQIAFPTTTVYLKNEDV
jgi:MscS family membrane protein